MREKWDVKIYFETTFHTFHTTSHLMSSLTVLSVSLPSSRRRDVSIDGLTGVCAEREDGLRRQKSVNE